MADQAAITAELKRRGVTLPGAAPDKSALQAEIKRRGLTVPPAPGKNGTQPVVAGPDKSQPGFFSSLFKPAGSFDTSTPPDKMSAEEKLALAAAGDPAMKGELAKQGLPPNIDWNQGVSLGDTRDFLAADNDAERTRVLEAGKKAGKWNGYGQAAGVWFVDKGGKPVAIMGTDGVKAFAASVAAHPIQSAAMAASSLAPEFRAAGAVKSGAEVTMKYIFKRGMSGTVYNMGRAGIVAAASTAGYAADEAVKWWRGLWEKSSDEEKHQLGVAALTGALPEMFLRTAGSIIRTVGSGYAPFLTPAQRGQTMDALRRGMVPRISQATHGAAKFLPFEQSMSEYIFGFPADERNSAAVQQIILEQAKKAGMSDAEAQQSLRHIMASTSQRIDSTAINEQMRAGAQARIAQGQAGVEGQRQMLQTTLDDQLKGIEKGIGSSDPQTQTLVREGLIKARQQFSQEVGKIYDEVGKLAEGATIDTTDIKAVAQDVWKQLPKDQNGQVVLEGKPQLGGTMVKLMNLPPNIDFATAQRLRSELFNAGVYADLTPSHGLYEMNRVARAVDDSFGQAGVPPAAAAKLREADAAWKAGIGKFKGLLVRQLYTEAEKGRIADPRTIANLIFNKQYTGEALRIKGMVPAETWQKVTAAYWEQLKAGAIDTATGALDAKKFLKLVNDQRGMLDTAFGRDKAKQIIQFANRNAVLNGKLDAKALSADNFFHQLTKYEGDKATLDSRMKSDFVHMLTGPQAERINAVDYMLEDPKRIVEAKKFYGEGSNEWQQVKNTVMTRLLSAGVTPDKSLMGVIFKPGGLSGMLSKYSQKDLADIFGPEHAADLRQLAKTIDFMTAKPVGKMTGVFAAAQLVLHPLGHIPAIAQLYLQGQLFAQPWFVKWLTQGLEKGTMENLQRAATLAKATAYSMLPGATQMGPGVGINKLHQMTQPVQTDAMQ